MYSTASGYAPWQANGSMSPHNPPTAFIPVPTRNAYMSQSGLLPPPSYVPGPLPLHQAPTPLNTSAAPMTPALKKKPTEWPPDVRDYVSRSFAPESQIATISKQDVEGKLKQVITEAANTNQLNSLNWKEMPLPQHIIQAERNRAILAAPFPAPSFPPRAPVSNATPVAPPFNTHESLRKRKSQEMSADNDNATQPPWRHGKPGVSLADRVTHVPTPEKRQKLDANKSHSKFDASLEQRRKRFEANGPKSPHKPASSHGTPQPELTGPVVGRSQKLEKNYFRLTSAPNPEDVRPLAILRQTLDLLKKRWRTDSNYVYICDQFKSLRQDLTVQHIKNDFTTNVYEIHARIALEKGDLGEYNQCQTQLRALYKQKLGGHPSEFVAYRILYLIHTCNRTDMNDVLSDLTPADKLEPAVQHALDVRSALALGNYHKFFKLYLTVPNMGGYLMDMFIERERLAAMARICKAYKPDVRLRFITEELAFESDEETARFMLDHGAETLLQTKEEHVRLLTGKAGALFEDAQRAAFRQVDIKGQI